MLKVKRLHPDAVSPTVAHPGEDLAYDLYALEYCFVGPGLSAKIRTGIAASAFDSRFGIQTPLGLIIKDRSSMAASEIVVGGGVIDAGYRGEIIVLMFNRGSASYGIARGQKIAQMIPVPVLTGAVVEVDKLSESSRGENGFGSTGI